MKKVISRILVVILFATLVFTNYSYTVKASSNYDILGKTSVTVQDLKIWAKSKNASDTFISLADIYYRLSSQRGGVNPVIAYAQSALETNFGNFGGVLDATYFNPCGLKTATGGDNSDPNAHQRFSSWEQGVTAHLDHLALYAGATGYPRTDTPDPRHFSSIFGTAKTIDELANKWATDSEYGNKIKAKVDEILNTSRANLSPVINLEGFNNGQVVYDNNLSVSGWAISPYGSTSMKVYINGKSIQQVDSFYERSDVNNAFSNYINALNSGFSLNLQNLLSEGNNTLTLELYGADGSKYCRSYSVFYKKLELVSNIESLRNNQVITGNSISISGWSLNPSGMKSVNIYVNGTLSTQVTNFYERKDVSSAFPLYKNSSNSGFSTSISTTSLKDGNNVLKFEYVGNDNSKKVDEITVTTTIPSPNLFIESPNDGVTVSDKIINFSGWAVDYSGVSKVIVGVNGKQSLEVSNFYDRTDVNKIYKNYLNSIKSGFAFSIPASSFTSGVNKVTITSVGNNGQQTTVNRNISLVKASPINFVEQPRWSSSYNNSDVTVGGWSVNSSGLDRVEVYANDIKVSTITSFYDRKDIESAYSNRYDNSLQSGYVTTIRSADLKRGNNAIRIISYGKDGSTAESSGYITENKPDSRLWIESPAGSVSVKNDDVNISGWAVDPSGVKGINVFVNGTIYSSFTTFYQRQDIQAAYRSYTGSLNSGFNVKISKDIVNDGANTVKLVAVGNDGTETAYTLNVNNELPKPVLFIETPSSGSKIVGTSVTVSGWTVASRGVKEVGVSINGQYYDKASYGATRLDVAQAFSSYKDSLSSGFSLQIPATSFKNGDNIIDVTVVGNEGFKATQRVTIAKNKLVVIDPGHNFGGDDGAYSPDKAYNERTLNMQVAVKLQSKLVDMGYTVVMTRQPWETPIDDVQTSLKKRTDLANNLKADLFISLHHDSGTASSTGMSTYYSTFKPGLKNVEADLIPLTSGYDGYTDIKPTSEAITSRTFAKNVVEALSSKCNYPKIGNDSGRIGYIDRNLNVTVNTNMPSVLIELGFISNLNEAARCANQDEQQNKANVIADEVKKMF